MMRKPSGKWAAACLLAALLAAAGCGRSGPALTASTVDVVDAAQLAALLKPNGSPAVVVNFWATWCPPCVEEMRELSEFYRAYASRGVKFVSVSVDDPGTVEDRVKPFVTQKTLPFPVHVLSDRSPEAVAKMLNLDWSGAVPATFVFGKNGEAVRTWHEAVTRKDLSQSVDSLLSK